ncbi:MAG: hypothetical protein WAU86_10210, partial [Oricola sp.]
PASRGEYERVFHVDMRLFWSAVSVMVLLLCAIMAMTINSYLTRETQLAANESLTAAREPRRFSASEALPSVSLVSDVDRQLRAAFEDAIPRFGSVVYRSDRAVTVDHPLADFYIQTVPTGERSLNVQFFHRESGILIGADQIPAGVNDPLLADQVSRILSRFLPVGGVIYAFLESDGRLNPLTRCMSLTAAYFNEQTAERHLAAYRCHEDLMKDGVKSALVYSDMAGLTVETITDGYEYPTEASLVTAVTMARRAVELAPNLAQAHRALGWALQVSGEHLAALDQIREAHALNHYDLSIAASYGNTLVAVGDFTSAVNVLERATKASPVHPTWWDYSLFLAAFQNGRDDLISVSARNLVGRERSHYCAARLIAAYLEGDDAMRTKMLAEISSRDNAFLRDPLEFYSRAMPPDAARKLVRALGDAGLKSANTNDG